MIVVTLGIILRRGNWDLFCEEKGTSVWAVAEGGGDITVSLTEQEAVRYGILKK